MDDYLFIYKSYENDNIVVVNGKQSEHFRNDKTWTHIATIKPQSFIQTILSENRAIVETYT